MREDPKLTTIKRTLVKKLRLEDMDVRVTKMRETGIEEEKVTSHVIIRELGLDPVKLKAFRPRRMRNTKKIVRRARTS